MNSFEPILENVMSNYMTCAQMLFGAKVRYCIAYKGNETGFYIFRRKYEHGFKVDAHQENFEGS